MAKVGRIESQKYRIETIRVISDRDVRPHGLRVPCSALCLSSDLPYLRNGILFAELFRISSSTVIQFVNRDPFTMRKKFASMCLVN